MLFQRKQLRVNFEKSPTKLETENQIHATVKTMLIYIHYNNWNANFFLHVRQWSETSTVYWFVCVLPTSVMMS